MNHSVEKILYQKAALIFEELGFLIPQSDICDHYQTDNPCAVVTFRGPFVGCLLVSVTGEILSTIAKNMLAREKPAGKQMEEDALCELDKFCYLLHENSIPYLLANTPSLESCPFLPEKGYAQFLLLSYHKHSSKFLQIIVG